MARDAGAVEGRRVALRALLAGGEASSSAPPPARAEEEAATRAPSKGLLRGLRCTSAAASQAFEPESVARPSAADWRGLGCTSAVGVHAPADAAADWRGRQRRRKGNRERRKARGGGGDAAGMGGDVWCTPGVPFHAEASSVDCVVAPHPHQSTVVTRRRAQAERSHREMMMFRTRLLLGRLGMYDQYQDWRLDVDNMTYEELLDLEDRMGYVSTGLREDEILQSLRMVKHTPFNTKHFSTEMDRRCSICQEEFEAGEEIGKLSCGHNYHVHCIKQWLSRKNSCPVCKTAVSKA
ncbi:hypothetical protein PR202_gb02016 [Eleusine coracana subsp. coracana]|uniref:RING-type E3 ubiquitin transferase n=1 Tax=Eleusine coracana subsp. coracana TaxID=191504 RepID=A0AAV5DXI7_ELECO|nr:hypothetical protein PR202_gb02016 [Eleusine coracana subsp. coracana]